MSPISKNSKSDCPDLHKKGNKSTKWWTKWPASPSPVNWFSLPQFDACVVHYPQHKALSLWLTQPT